MTPHYRQLTISLTLIFALSTAGFAADKPRAAAQSKFRQNLTEISYPVTAGPADARSLKMDFSGNKILEYDYSQLVSSSQDTTINGTKVGQEVLTEGKMLLKSQGDKTATLVIQDLKVEMTTDFQGEKKTINTAAPTMVVPGVQENGRMQAGFVSQDLLFQILFPLTNDKLTVGDSFTQKLSMPFNVMGSVIPVFGKGKTVLKNYVVIDGIICARLETEIDISDISVPSEIEGEFGCAVTGKAVSFFDIENNSFMNSTIAMLMTMSIDAPLPKLELPDEVPKDKIPERMQMEMSNDNFISYSRTGLQAQ